jgi:hypothetical protein
MLIFDDDTNAIILDSVYTPTPTEYMWVLDLSIMDYTLAPLMNLEEIIGPTIELMIYGFKFNVPANWNILVFDEETLQLDVVEISELAGANFTSFVINAEDPLITRYLPGTIVMTNYMIEHVNVVPSLAKHQMLCHPIGPKQWVNVAPSDTYNKYFRGLVVGDIIT